MYFDSVAKEAEKFFPGLKASLCTLLAQTLSDNILAEIVKQNRGDSDETLQPSHLPLVKEGWFIVSWRLCYQFRNNSVENQAFVLILSAAKAKDSSHLQLVDAVDRRGLYKITPEIENIFLIAEGVFRNNKSGNLLRKNDTNEMVGTLISDLELISHFNSVVEDSSWKVAIHPKTQIPKKADVEKSCTSFSNT